MFDTRSGFWLLASIGITAVLATGAVILFAPDDELTYDTFAAAIGFPMAVILPMIAILSVTSEWSQRSGLTTFTLVPHRGRVDPGQGDRSRSAVGVVSMLLAFGDRRARQHRRHGDRRGHRPSGTHGFGVLGYIVLGNVLGLLVGFMLGVADPQLRRRDRGATSSTRSCCRPCRCCWPTASSGSATCSPGSTSTSPRASSFNGVDDRRAVGPPRRHRRDLAGRPARGRAWPW